MKLGLGNLVLALAAVAVAATNAAAFTCTTAVKQGDADPDALILGSRFAEPVDCNGSGDVALVAQARGAKDKLYVYPNGGAAEVVARATGPSVAGLPNFRSSNVFRFQSINDAGDVAFRGSLTKGSGVFVRPAGGALRKCARDGDTSPAGGTFTSFPHVSELNPSGSLAFVADVDGGPDGVFACDCSVDPCAVSTLQLVGATTVPSGREICSFLGVGVSDSVFATRATIAPSCASDPDVAAILRNATEIAVAGEPCPMPPGGTYASFQQNPQLNSSDDVGYQARCGSRSGLFLNGSVIVQRGDPSPVGGVQGHLAAFQLSDSDEFIFRSTVSGASARFCAFRTDGKIVCNTDAPPFGERYSNIREPGASRDGDWACVRVRVKDVPGTSPRFKTAVARCEE